VQKIKFIGQGFQKSEHEQIKQTDTQTDATEGIPQPQSQVVAYLVW